MSRLSPNENDVAPAPTAAEIFIGILDEIGDLQLLMEVFYFTRDADCLAVLRWMAMLPERERRLLGKFARSAHEGQAVHVDISEAGTLKMTLSRVLKNE